MASTIAATSHADRPATFWTPASGEFFDLSNWSLGMPSTSIDAKIDNQGTATITTPSFQSAGYVFLASAQNTRGTLEISGSGTASFTTIVVGAVNSTGFLNVSSGGSLTSFGGALGSDYLGNGTATVTDPGSLWKLTGSRMVVGGNGMGSLRLQNNGVATIANGTGRVELGNHPLADGTLQIGAGGGAGVLNASEVFNGEGKATIVFNHTEPYYAFAPKVYGLNTINGYLNIRHEGTGTTALTAPQNEMAGTITVANGTLLVSGSLVGSSTEVFDEEEEILVLEKTVGTIDVQTDGTLGGTGFIEGNTGISGTLSPGLSAGVLKFGGDLTLNSNSKVKIELGGKIRGNQFDGVDVAGAMLYAGTLEIVLQNGFLPELGDSFELFKGFTSFSGSFSLIEFSNGGYEGVFDPQTGVVVIVPEPTASALTLIGLGSLVLRRRQTSSRTLPLL